MHDDIAWEENGAPTELKQLKLHVSSLRNLTDASDDMWRTLRVWMDNGRPKDPYGPILTLVTNSTAGTDSAASYLRDTDRDVKTALARLEETARNSTSKDTRVARQQFLNLTPSERMTFVGRIYVADRSADIDEVIHEVTERLRPGAPIEQFDIYLDQVWSWWAATSLAMLKGDRGPVPVEEMLTAIERIRDQFTRDNLPVLVDVHEVDVDAVLLQHGGRPYVHQLKILSVLPASCTKQSSTTNRRTSRTRVGSVCILSITTR